MFCKSHLLPLSTSSFNPRKQLTKADFKIFPGSTHHYSLEKDHKISWTDCRNSTPLHSLFQTMSDSSHHKCLLLCRRSVCFKLSSVQLGRPKAPCKNFYLWLLCVHPANSSYVPWFWPQVVCRALFSQHPLHTKLAYPSNWLKPLATGALTPYFILLTCLVKLSFHILHTTFTTLTLPLLLPLGLGRSF